MKNKKQKQNQLKKLLSDYKVVISNEDTFEEKLSFRINKISTFVLFLTYSAIVILATIGIVFFTDVRELVPGYSPPKLLNQVIDLSKKADSLEKKINLDTQFYKSIEDVLSGNTDTIILRDDISKKINLEEESFSLISPNLQDSVLRKYVEKQDEFNLTKNELIVSDKTFFPPIRGSITQRFNINESHYAIDIAADIGSPVKSVLDGRIIFSEWSIDTGYVIIIDHGDNIISVYKHNSKALKDQNDFVNAGEIIALSGNQGNLSTGPHLHFELWNNGVPINPEIFLKID